MSATNTTPNIGLPSFIGTDKPAWLTDWNGAMSTIDTEIGTIKTGVSGDETRIGNLENSVSSLNTTVSNHTTSITALNTQVATQGGTINTITSLIGNGTPTTTDQTIIGAINELHANQGDLANLVTTDKSSFVAAINEVAGGGGGSIAASAVSYNNATSGLTANNVQAAIDEIAQGGGSGQYDFDLTAHLNDLSITPASSVSVNGSAMHSAFNNDYSIGKIYGYISFHLDRAITPGSTWTKIASFSTALAPAAAFDIYASSAHGWNTSDHFLDWYEVRFHVNTNGTIDIEVNHTGASPTSLQIELDINFAPCIYFFKDFGD